jgi:flagellar biosynthetic protein FliS
LNTDDYVLRIAAATPVQLVIINHEIMMAYITDALEALDKGDTPAFDKSVNGAKNSLESLINGLNFETEIAHELYDLYLYAGERLNRVCFSADKDAAQDVLAMFGNLLEGWRFIEDTPDTRVDENVSVPKVYAGLTYHRDGLAEYVVEDENRGFKA